MTQQLRHPFWGHLLWGLNQRLPKLLLLLVILAQGAHSFDSCAAHLGLPPARSFATLTVLATSECAAPNCAVCHPAPVHRDGCEVTSELFTLSSSDRFQLEPPLYISVPAAVSLPDIIDLMPVTSAFSSRAGPDVPTLHSTFCRNPLAGRAPPVSA